MHAVGFTTPGHVSCFHGSRPARGADAGCGLHDSGGLSRGRDAVPGRALPAALLSAQDLLVAALLLARLIRHPAPAARSWSPLSGARICGPSRLRGALLGSPRSGSTRVSTRPGQHHSSGVVAPPIRAYSAP